MDVLNAHSDRFTVLIRALGNSGVGDILKKRKYIIQSEKILFNTSVECWHKIETGPFTLFAPTNDAFKALPDALKSTLKNDLKRSMMGRVVAGLQSTDGEDFNSLNGINYKITVTDTGIIQLPSTNQVKFQFVVIN